MRRSSILLVAVALVIATAVTAGASTGSKVPVAAATGVTATSVKVGGLGAAALYGGAEIGAKARFQRANDAGGVNGRTIDFVGLRDDGGDAKLDQAAAAKLVGTDQVFAIVPTVTTDLGAASDLANQKVPYFGWALSSNFCGNYGFGYSGCLISSKGTSNVWGVLVKRFFGAQGSGKTAAVLTENTPSGAYLAAALASAVKGGGLKVVYRGNVLPVPAGGGYDTLLKAALTGDGGKPASAIFAIGSISNITLVKQALHDAGYLGVFTDAIEYDPTTVSTASGAAIFLETAAVETKATNPAMQQLATDVEKAAPGSAITASVIAGYFSADMFLAALKNAGKNLTAASFLKAANKLTYKVANTVGPTKFPAAHTQPTPCGSLVQSDGIAFKVKVPYTCGKVVAVK